MTLTRPRKQRIMEKAGLRYIAAWLPVELAEKLKPEIEKAKVAETAALAEISKAEQL